MNVNSNYLPQQDFNLFRTSIMLVPMEVESLVGFMNLLFFRIRTKPFGTVNIVASFYFFLCSKI